MNRYPQGFERVFGTALRIQAADLVLHLANQLLTLPARRKENQRNTYRYEFLRSVIGCRFCLSGSKYKAEYWCAKSRMKAVEVDATDRAKRSHVAIEINIEYKSFITTWRSW